MDTKWTREKCIKDIGILILGKYEHNARIGNAADKKRNKGKNIAKAEEYKNTKDEAYFNFGFEHEHGERN